jgi:hypothetical protein
MKMVSRGNRSYGVSIQNSAKGLFVDIENVYESGTNGTAWDCNAADIAGAIKFIDCHCEGWATGHRMAGTPTDPDYMKTYTRCTASGNMVVAGRPWAEFAATWNGFEYVTATDPMTLTDAAFAAGDRQLVPAPAAGGVSSRRCTIAGSPGTWKTETTLAS